MAYVGQKTAPQRMNMPAIAKDIGKRLGALVLLPFVLLFMVVRPDLFQPDE